MRVRVQAIQDRSSRGVRSPYVVRWTLGGKTKSKSFSHKQPADRYRSQLITAVAEGQTFDLLTGEPAEWNTPTATVSEYSHTWIGENWATSQPKSRQKAIENLARFLVIAVDSSCPVQPGPAARAEIRNWLIAGRENRQSGPAAKCPRWLRRHSLPFTELTATRCVELTKLLFLKDDGQPMAKSTASRQRATVSSFLFDAVNAGVIKSNPWPATKRGRTKNAKATQVDGMSLPNPTEARATIDALINHSPGSIAYRVLASIVYFAGLRPSEARALDVADLTLPASGWGSIYVQRAIKDAGGGYGTTDEMSGVTKTAVERRVPIPEELVVILNEFLDGRTSGPLTQTAGGNAISLSAWGKAWRAARGDETWRLYDLRHACATLWLGAGVPVGEVARRLGHSTEVLLKKYAGVLSTDEDLSNARIDAALRNELLDH